MRNRNSEEIRMLERPDLRIQRVAHQVQPGTSDLGIVPDLAGGRPVGEHFRQCFVVPLLWIVQDHRHGLEVATAGCLRETLLQRLKMRGAGRRQRGLDGRRRWSGLRRCKADRACGNGQSKCSQYAPSSGDDLHGVISRLPSSSR